MVRADVTQIVRADVTQMVLADGLAGCFLGSLDKSVHLDDVGVGFCFLFRLGPAQSFAQPFGYRWRGAAGGIPVRDFQAYPAGKEIADVQGHFFARRIYDFGFQVWISVQYG